MPFNVFRSSDAGCPTMSGTAGALITLLDACLVNGYNTQTITITRSGTTATATCTSHGFVWGQKVTVSGANETEYNGVFRISNITANTFDYTVSGSPATPATGTISAKVTPLGWTKPYTGTNLAAYRLGTATAGGYQGYLRVDDTNATDARVVGYATMSDVNTGTYQHPTTAQVSGGAYHRKSTTAAATARPWILWGNEYGFYLKSWGDQTDTALTPQSLNFVTGSNRHGMYFGAFESGISGDLYAGILMAGNSNAASDRIGPQSGIGTANTLAWMTGDYLGSANSPTPSNQYATYPSVSGGNATNNSVFPNTITGKVEIVRGGVLHESASSRYQYRGSLQGVINTWTDTYTACRYWDILTNGTEEYLVVPIANATSLNGSWLVRLDADDPSWQIIT